VLNPNARPFWLFNYLIFNRQKFVAQSSQLIQPLISTDAVSGLTHFVPGVSVQDGVESSDRLVSRGDSVSRYFQVALTSIPLAGADLLAISSAYLVATLATYNIFGANYYWGLWNNLFAVCLCHMIVGMFLGLFPASGMNPVRELRSQISSVCISFVLLVALNGIVGQVTRNEILTIMLAFPLTVAIAPPARFSTRKIVSRCKWWGEKVIIVGMNQQARSIYKFMAHLPQRGLKPIGVVVGNLSEYWNAENSDQIEFLGSADDLIKLCRKKKCHWVIAAVADMPESEIQNILAKVSLVPNLIVVDSKLSMPTIWVESFDAAGLAGIHIRDRMLFPFQRLSKRVFDFALSLVLLALISPLLLAIALYIKLMAPGPVFYRHEGRIGRGGKTFGAWKIRTMIVNSDLVLKQHLAANAEAQAEWNRDLKLKNDPRIIPGIGQFLRRSSLDELPQLLNVLKGEMSLVGPRPIYTKQEVDKFSEMYPLYLRVRPGMTGLWQVSGRNNTTYDDRVRLDTYYVRNWSLWLDYFILLRTVRTVLLREGSY
jgi:Undecaprenyl-phosphate galactose phosphotransferase WbaP